MKKNIISFLILGGIMFGCTDLEELPQQSLSTELAFSDRQATIGSMLGVYSLSQQFDVYGSLPAVISDFQSDNVTFIGSFPTLQDIREYATRSDNATVRDLWRQHYRVIAGANAVIANAPDVPDATLTDADRAQLVGEGKFMRAIMHLQLLNLFSQPIQIGGAGAEGIPVVLEPFTGEVIEYPRSTVGEVYAQIQQDLEEALPAVPDSYDASDFTRARATKGSVRALLSRVHLYKGEWAQAAERANEVLASDLYSLGTDYGFFSEIHPEYVFTVLNSAIDNGRTGSGGWAAYFSPAEAGGRGDAPMSSFIVDAFNEEEGDLRFESQSRVGDNGRVYTTKFPDAVTNSDNAPIIRTTEVALNRAEALAQVNGVNEESLSIMNQLRERAGLDVWAAGDFGSPNDFITAILNERRKELAFEGFRRMDLLRYEMPLRPEGDQYFAQSQPGANLTILPIPNVERENNPALTQNPGY